MLKIVLSTAAAYSAQGSPSDPRARIDALPPSPSRRRTASSMRARLASSSAMRSRLRMYPMDAREVRSRRRASPSRASLAFASSPDAARRASPPTRAVTARAHHHDVSRKERARSGDFLSSRPTRCVSTQDATDVGCKKCAPWGDFRVNAREETVRGVIPRDAGDRSSGDGEREIAANSLSASPLEHDTRVREQCEGPPVPGSTDVDRRAGDGTPRRTSRRSRRCRSRVDDRARDRG